MKFHFRSVPPAANLPQGWIRHSIVRSKPIYVGLIVTGLVYFFVQLSPHKISDCKTLAISAFLTIMGFVVGFLLHEILHMVIPPIPSRLRRLIVGLGLPNKPIPSPWVSVEGVQPKWQYMAMSIAPFICLGIGPALFTTRLEEHFSVYFVISLTAINIGSSAWDVNLFWVLMRTRCDQIIDEEGGFSYHPVP